jgi:hypothetical protein
MDAFNNQPPVAGAVADLIEAATALCQRGQPLRIDLAIGEWRLLLEVGPVAAATAASPAAPPTTGSRADVWQALCDGGARMTLSEVMSDLAERGKEWDERTVRRALKRLEEMGLVDHDDRSKPPGYGVVHRS